MSRGEDFDWHRCDGCGRGTTAVYPALPERDLCRACWEREGDAAIAAFEAEEDRRAAAAR